MTYLLDTQLLLWLVLEPEKLSPAAKTVLLDVGNNLMFSTLSIWEVAIKFGLGRDDFTIRPQALRQELLDNRLVELSITSEHAFVVPTLPPIHKDPFDRLLIAQAIAEDVTLLTSDRKIGQYPGPIRYI